MKGDDFSFDSGVHKTSSSSTEHHVMTPVRRSTKIPLIPPKIPVRADDWLLYDLESPIAMNNRALSFGRVWTRHGRLIVTCAQESVIRCD